MVPVDDLDFGELRLLEVDNRIVAPSNTHIRILVTAVDVLHSFAIPSLGIKLDCCPGRLNQTALFLLRDGVFYGQCSEICGVGHANMPIVIESVSLEKYISWLVEKI
jgi:cytochrome c oxidase subunit 2